jgi:hypothetical protein
MHTNYPCVFADYQLASTAPWIRFFLEAQASLTSSAPTAEAAAATAAAAKGTSGSAASSPRSSSSYVQHAV